MKFDVEYDVIVCGGGGSGKSAAYTIGSESDLTCCLLEKMPETGGTSQYAEGSAASESSEQKSRPHPDYPGELPEGAHFPSHEEHYQRYLDYSHFRANPDVVKAYVWNSGETIDIMKDLGIEFTDVTIYAFNQKLELYTFHRPEGLGAHVQETLLRACLNHGVDIFCNTPAKELLFEDGKIVGVLATDADGNDLRVGGKAIILATGGFGNNMEMVKKYSWMPWLSETNYQCVPGENTGEGVQMALSAGCGTRGLGTIMVNMCTIGRTLDAHINGAGYNPNLWINSKGERFANEVRGMSVADSGNTMGQNVDGIMWSVFDTDQHDYFLEQGSDIGLGDFIPYHMKFTHLDAEFDASLEAQDGAVAKADTLEGLAEQMGVPVDRFLACVERYNEMCDNGKDEDYFKPAEYMRPLRRPPFYAVHQAPTILVSDGGIYVNGDFQVCDNDYNPVYGGNLYAVGNEASGLYGDTYNLDCPGTANGFAHTSGRLAARHAIKQLTGEA